MENIRLEDFILEKFTETKIPEEALEVVFENEEMVLSSENGQKKCQSLLFPFSRSPLQSVAIKGYTILLEPDNNVHKKEIIEVTLDIKDFIGFNWQPGDTIAILPSNSSKDTLELLNLLDLNIKGDTKCSVRISSTCTKKTAKVPAYIPSKTTPREIIRDCLNIKCVLKKQFLRCLAEYCSDNKEKIFLKSLCSKEGSGYYNELIIKRSFTLADILKLCPSCKPSLSLIVEHLSRLLPRPYSIASSPLKTSKEISFIFSILDTEPGVTTSMLKEKISKESENLVIYLRETNYFRYIEEDFFKNQILIAVGTGLAPFLGFLQHREHMMNVNNNCRPGNTWLFVGATCKQAVIYRRQLLRWKSLNVLNKFVECYSRVSTSNSHYVQQALDCHSEELVDLINKPETIIYICADGGHISKCIEKSLENILARELSITNEESMDMIKDFKAKKKYREDIWI